MSRPSDSLQPSSKRRPGAQLTKDDDEESDGDAPAIDPGTWGKADQATMARRKIIKARRGAGGAVAASEEAAGGATAATDSSSNPFAGVSLTSPAAAGSNPFAGVSLLASKVPETGKGTSSDNPPSSIGGEQTAGKEHGAAAAAAAKETAAEQENAADNPTDETKTDATPVQKPPEAAGQASNTPANPSAVNAEQNGAATSSQPGEDKKQAPADATQASAGGPSLFGSTGFGGFGTLGSNSSGGGAFGSLGNSSGFAGGFGGFAAAAKDGGSSGGSLFGGYTAPQPGSSLFGSSTAPAFGSSVGPGTKQGKDGDNDDEDKTADADGEGDAVFGGADVPPVVQLSEVPKQTGEEQETAVFAGDGALFEFVDGKEWKERGRGELRINLNQKSQQARLVMRQRGSQRLLLNANLYPKMSTCKMVGGKGVTFAAVNAAIGAAGAAGDDKGDAAADGNEPPAVQSTDASSQEGAATATAAVTAAASAAMKTYAFRVKSSDRIEAFVATVDRYKGTAAALDSEADKTNDAGTAAEQEV